jgi:hypothetical protein
MVPKLKELPLYEGAILTCLAASSSSVIEQLRSSSLKRNSVTACAAGVLCCVVLSHLSHLDLEAAFHSGIGFAKTLVYYVLVVSVVRSFDRLRKFLIWLCLIIGLLSSILLLIYYGIVSPPLLNAYHERQQDMIDEETGEPVILARLQGVGIYGNPNDLSRLLVVGILLCLYLLRERRLGMFRLSFVPLICILGHALQLTYSRGGLLSLLAGLAALCLRRFGGGKSLVVGAVALPLLLSLFGGRQTQIGASSGTGYQRIELWNEGFMLFQTSPVFGIGMNRYQDEVGLAAHNSFVQAYVDLGFLGGSFFLGIFYLPLRALIVKGPGSHLRPQSDEERFEPFLLGILSATVLGMMSSTRTYSHHTYLIAGLAACYLGGPSVRKEIRLPRFDGNLVGRIGMASIVVLLLLYLCVRISLR